MVACRPRLPRRQHLPRTARIGQIGGVSTWSSPAPALPRSAGSGSATGASSRLPSLGGACRVVALGCAAILAWPRPLPLGRRCSAPVLLHDVTLERLPAHRLHDPSLAWDSHEASKNYIPDFVYNTSSHHADRDACVGQALLPQGSSPWDGGYAHREDLPARCVDRADTEAHSHHHEPQCQQQCLHAAQGGHPLRAHAGVDAGPEGLCQDGLGLHDLGRGALCSAWTLPREQLPGLHFWRSRRSHLHRATRNAIQVASAFVLHPGHARRLLRVLRRYGACGRDGDVRARCLQLGAHHLGDLLGRLREPCPLHHHACGDGSPLPGRRSRSWTAHRLVRPRLPGFAMLGFRRRRDRLRGQQPTGYPSDLDLTDPHGGPLRGHDSTSGRRHECPAGHDEEAGPVRDADAGAPEVSGQPGCRDHLQRVSGCQAFAGLGPAKAERSTGVVRAGAPEWQGCPCRCREWCPSDLASGHRAAAEQPSSGKPCPSRSRSPGHGLEHRQAPRVHGQERARCLHRGAEELPRHPDPRLAAPRRLPAEVGPCLLRRGLQERQHGRELRTRRSSGELMGSWTARPRRRSRASWRTSTRCSWWTASPGSSTA